MKKSLIFGAIIVIIVFFVALAVYFLFFSGEGWLTYQNSRYDFSLQYPPDWTLGEPEADNAGRTIASPDGAVNCYVYGFANALTGEQGDPQTLEEFIAWLTGEKSADERYVKVLSQTKTVLSGYPAVQLTLEKNMNLKDAVYALGKESGRGLFCDYGRQTAVREKYRGVFQKMAESFTIGVNLDGETVAITGTENCVNLVNGVVVPLKDYQTFIDDKYPEVTSISRENWNKKKLPAQVLTLQNQDYQCYPIPKEFEPEVETPGIQPERAVTKVEWHCELPYQVWQYLASDKTAQKANLEKQGYTCQKEECLTEQADQTKNEFVWLCVK